MITLEYEHFWNLFWVLAVQSMSLCGNLSTPFKMGMMSVDCWADVRSFGQHSSENCVFGVQLSNCLGVYTAGRRLFGSIVVFGFPVLGVVALLRNGG